MPSMRIGGEPYQFETEANAGISLSTGDRWWGTLCKWRHGTSGKWNRTTLIDIHPFDLDQVAAALKAWIEQQR